MFLEFSSTSLTFSLKAKTKKESPKALFPVFCLYLVILSPDR